MLKKMNETMMNETKEPGDNLNQEVVILDEKGYDITEFLCRCPNKTSDNNFGE